MTFRQLVDNWYIGNRSNSVPPYATLQNLHVKHILNKKGQPGGAVVLRKMRHLMKSFLDYAVVMGKQQLVPTRKINWEPEKINSLWESCGLPFLRYLYDGARGDRKNEMSWTTIYIYNRLVKKKKKR